MPLAGDIQVGSPWQVEEGRDSAGVSILWINTEGCLSANILFGEPVFLSNSVTHCHLSSNKVATETEKYNEDISGASKVGAKGRAPPAQHTFYALGLFGLSATITHSLLTVIIRISEPITLTVLQNARKQKLKSSYGAFSAFILLTNIVDANRRNICLALTHGDTQRGGHLRTNNNRQGRWRWRSRYRTWQSFRIFSKSEVEQDSS